MNEFKRVKHGEQPGDVSRRTKIAMREKRMAELPLYINERCARAFRKYLQEKSRTVQRRRDWRLTLKELASRLS